VVTVVDPQALVLGILVKDLAVLKAQRQDNPKLEYENPIKELFKNQLACVNLVLLAKTDLIEPFQLHQVKEWLR
jgi:cobalamin biosynthesis protein CobW